MYLHEKIDKQKFLDAFDGAMFGLPSDVAKEISIAKENLEHGIDSSMGVKPYKEFMFHVFSVIRTLGSEDPGKMLQLMKDKNGLQVGLDKTIDKLNQVREEFKTSSKLTRENILAFIRYHLPTTLHFAAFKHFNIDSTTWNNYINKQNARPGQDKGFTESRDEALKSAGDDCDCIACALRKRAKDNQPVNADEFFEMLLGAFGKTSKPKVNGEDLSKEKKMGDSPLPETEDPLDKWLVKNITDMTRIMNRMQGELDELRRAVNKKAFDGEAPGNH